MNVHYHATCVQARDTLTKLPHLSTARSRVSVTFHLSQCEDCRHWFLHERQPLPLHMEQTHYTIYQAILTNEENAVVAADARFAADHRN